MTKFSIRHILAVGALVAVFFGGYGLGIRHERERKEGGLLDHLNATIDPDSWLTNEGASTVRPYTSSFTECTVEDIFGSRQAFQSMLDSENQNSLVNDPFGTSGSSELQDDPFATRIPSPGASGFDSSHENSD